MVRKGNITGTASSMPAGLAMGGAVSLGITLLGSAVLAWLVHGERMDLDKIGYGILVLLLLGAFLGAEVAFRKIRRQRLLVCAASGVIYFGLLMALTALFFGGQYSAVGVTALLILAGSGTAGLLGLSGGRGGKGHKIRLPRR